MFLLYYIIKPDTVIIPKIEDLNKKKWLIGFFLGFLLVSAVALVMTFLLQRKEMVCISNIWFRSIWQQLIYSVFVVELQIKLFLYFLMINLSFTWRLYWACSTAWLVCLGNPVHHVVVTHSVFLRAPYLRQSHPLIITNSKWVSFGTK